MGADRSETKSTRVGPIFPVDEPKSANRKTTTAKTPRRVQTSAPRGFSLPGPRKKYGWTETSEKELGKIKKALDFVGRVMDNIGANANDLDGVYFQNKTEGRGYYDRGGAARQENAKRPIRRLAKRSNRTF